MVRFIDENKGNPGCDICDCQTVLVRATPQAPQEDEILDDEYVEAKLCPNCKAKLDHLCVDMIIRRTGTYDGTDIDVEEDEIVLGIYKCPECNAVLYDNDEDADDFITT